MMGNGAKIKSVFVCMCVCGEGGGGGSPVVRLRLWSKCSQRSKYPKSAALTVKISLVPRPLYPAFQPSGLRLIDNTHSEHVTHTNTYIQNNDRETVQISKQLP